MPSPRQAGVTLYGVSAFSPAQAWAVGDIYSPLTPIIYRWNGTAWRPVSPGAVPDSSLRDVAAIGVNDVWAVGYQEDEEAGDLTVTLHWDGVRWTRGVSSPNPSSENYLNEVAALAANDVWAVGYKETDTLYGELILHWDGSAWTESPTRTNGYRELTDVAALTANDVWAIGYQFSFTDGYQGLAMHWDGAAWSQLGTPNIGHGILANALYSVSGVSSDDIWAVGIGQQAMTVHWDGARWRIVPHPGDH